MEWTPGGQGACGLAGRDAASLLRGPLLHSLAKGKRGELCGPVLPASPRISTLVRRNLGGSRSQTRYAGLSHALQSLPPSLHTIWRNVLSRGHRPSNSYSDRKSVV